MAWEKATWDKDLFILFLTAPIFLLTSGALESMFWHAHRCMTWQHDFRDSWQGDVLLWWRCPVDPAILHKILYIYSHYWCLGYLMKQQRGLFTSWGQGYFKWWEDRNHRMVPHGQGASKDGNGKDSSSSTWTTTSLIRKNANPAIAELVLDKVHLEMLEPSVKSLTKLQVTLFRHLRVSEFFWESCQ